MDEDDNGKFRLERVKRKGMNNRPWPNHLPLLKANHKKRLFSDY